MRAKDIPEQVVELARIPQAGNLGDEHDRVVNCATDRNVFLGCDRNVVHELVSQRLIGNDDRPDAEVAANLVIIHRRTKRPIVDVSPETRVSHEGQHKGRLLPHRITVCDKFAQQFEQVRMSCRNSTLGGAVKIIEPAPFMFKHDAPEVSNQRGSLFRLRQPVTENRISEQRGKVLRSWFRATGLDRAVLCSSVQPLRAWRRDNPSRGDERR